MKRLYRLALVLLTLALASSLCACAKSYADGRSCSIMSKSLTEALDDGQEYTEFESTHREYYFDDTEHYDDCSLLYSRDTKDICEIGIFHAPDENSAKELVEDCREYLDEMRTSSRAFVESYAPQELSKLDHAQVRRFGNYVAYAILPVEKTEDFFGSLEKMLRS